MGLECVSKRGAVALLGSVRRRVVAALDRQSPASLREERLKESRVARARVAGREEHEGFVLRLVQFRGVEDGRVRVSRRVQLIGQVDRLPEERRRGHDLEAAVEGVSHGARAARGPRRARVPAVVGVQARVGRVTVERDTLAVDDDDALRPGERETQHVARRDREPITQTWLCSHIQVPSFPRLEKPGAGKSRSGSMAVTRSSVRRIGTSAAATCVRLTVFAFPSL